MRKLRMLSLCSGIGGIDLAAQWAGIEIAGQVEIQPFRRAVLAKQFPDVVRLNDIKEVRGDEFGEIDIVAGGIPCQPFSHAGKRKGTADDRHLWPFAFTIIQNVHPAWVLIENVTGFIEMALDLVATDLESEKYEVQAYVLPACALGAPHQRARCFVVAYSTVGRRQICQESKRIHTESDAPGTLAYSNGIGEPGQESRFSCGQRSTSESAGVCQWENRANMAYPMCQGQPSIRDGLSARTNNPTFSSGVGLADTCRQGLEIGYRSTTERGACTASDRRSTGSVESELGRGHDGLSARLDAHRWPSFPGQAQEEWEPPRTITKRLPYRNGYRNRRLAALGDAVVPQQIYPLFYWIAVLEGRIPT